MFVRQGMALVTSDMTGMDWSVGNLAAVRVPVRSHVQELKDTALAARSPGVA